MKNSLILERNHNWNLTCFYTSMEGVVFFCLTLLTQTIIQVTIYIIYYYEGIDNSSP